MKNILILLLVLGTFALEAQVITAAPSPKSKIEQTVGLTDITV